MLANVTSYNTSERSFPDIAHCVRPALTEVETYPIAKPNLTPPATPKPILISEDTIDW